MFIENHGDSLRGAHITTCDPEICTVLYPSKPILKPMLSLKMQMMGCRSDPMFLRN